MDDRSARGPAAWYDERRTEAAPFAAFYALEPSENPTVRPGPAQASALDADPMEAMVRGENLVIIARRSRPVVR